MRTTLSIDMIVREYLSEQSISSNSISIYFACLKNFYAWCALQQKDSRNLHKSDAIEYRKHALSIYSAKYTSQLITVLKKYYTWIKKKNYWENIFEDVKLPRSHNRFLKEPLTETQVLKLLSIFQRNTAKGKRDYLIVILMLLRGLRCVEVSRINYGDIIIKRGVRCINIQRKARNDKDDFINVHDIYNEIDAHIKMISNIQKETPVFQSMSRKNKNERINPQGIGKIITAYFKKAEIYSSMITPHSLRHTAAVTLIRNGYSIDQIQLFLGHSDSEITKIYTNYANNEIKLQGKEGKFLKNYFFKEII